LPTCHRHETTTRKAQRVRNNYTLVSTQSARRPQYSLQHQRSPPTAKMSLVLQELLKSNIATTIGSAPERQIWRQIAVLPVSAICQTTSRQIAKRPEQLAGVPAALGTADPCGSRSPDRAGPLFWHAWGQGASARGDRLGTLRPGPASRPLSGTLDGRLERRPPRHMCAPGAAWDRGQGQHYALESATRQIYGSNAGNAGRHRDVALCLVDKTAEAANP